jgi:glycosyltransferase involved in cell wall biosynthesis
MILIILPKNNPLEEAKPKPVVSAMIPYVLYSSYKEEICIFSSYTDNPKIDVNNKIFSKQQSTKKKYILAVLLEIQRLLDNGISIPIVEVHQDVSLAGIIAKNFPNIRVSVIKHGDYCINRFKEKFSLIRWFYYNRYIKYLHSIYTISNYVRLAIEKDYPKMETKIFTVYNTYGHISQSLITQENNNKKNQIVFAGKPVAHKGISEFILSLPPVLNKHLDYKAIIIGAFFSKKGKYLKEIDGLFEKNDIRKLIDDSRIVFLKNLNPDEVFKNMAESKIAVVPTKTNEPFGLVCLESHLAKCAVVSSGNGGLSEISGDYALYLDCVSKDEISNKLNILIENEKKLRILASSGFEYTYNKFDPKKLALILDAKRQESINEYKN